MWGACENVSPQGKVVFKICAEPSPYEGGEQGPAPGRARGVRRSAQPGKARPRLRAALGRLIRRELGKKRLSPSGGVAPEVVRLAGGCLQAVGSVR